MAKKPDYRIERRNRYLEDIGLRPYEYGVNWTFGTKKNRLKPHLC